MPTTCRFLLGLVASVLLLPLPAEAQARRDYRLSAPGATLTVALGWAQPRASSEIFDFAASELTFDRRDLQAIAFAADFAQPLSERSSLILGIAHAGARHPSELRAFVDENDLPIRQTTRFGRTSLGGALRYHLVRPGRAIGSFAWIPAPAVPWVGLGGGVMHYRFEQRGEFVDAGTLDIFEDRFTDDGWTPYVEGSAGLDVNLTPQYALSLGARYTSASARMGGDFVGFDRIDLSGLGVSLGFVLRF